MENVLYKAPFGNLKIVIANDALVGIDFLYDKSFLTDKKYSPLAKKIILELDEYLKKERITFDIPIKPKGTEFQMKTWQALLRIPYGTVTTYKDIAEKIACPKGARAVGNANNKNPIPIIIPCHRVIGCSGKLVGYAGGLKIKEYLLSLEGDKKKND